MAAWHSNRGRRVREDARCSHLCWATRCPANAAMRSAPGPRCASAPARCISTSDVTTPNTTCAMKLVMKLTHALQKSGLFTRNAPDAVNLAAVSRMSYSPPHAALKHRC